VPVKQLTAVGITDSAGIFLGARFPILLTSRADCDFNRLPKGAIRD